MSAPRIPLVLGTEFVTAEVDPAVERVLDDWMRAHLDDLRSRLEGFDTSVDEIQWPTFRRVVFQDDPEVLRAAADSAPESGGSES